MTEDLEEFYQDHEEDLNSKNFKLLIDEFEDVDCLFTGLETFDIKPVLNNDVNLIVTDIKKITKQTKNNKLF